MFYEVQIDDKTLALMEGEASGAIAKGGGPLEFTPEAALTVSVELMKAIATKISKEMGTAMVGTGCTFEVQFAIRADANGTVMIGQDSSRGQFKVTVKWLPFGVTQ